METLTFPLLQAEKALETITKNLAPCTVYVFGYRAESSSCGSVLLQAGGNNLTHHFDLLVFSNKAYSNGAADMAHLIAQRSKGEISATVLLHKVTDLKTKSRCQQWFFHNALRDGHRLCLDTAAVPYLPQNGVPMRDVERTRDHWLKCEAVSGLYLEAATNSERLDVERVKLSLLHQAVEYAALGLIRVFMGYTPNTYGLSYLLGLCRHFTGLPQCFPQVFEADIARFKLLCAPPAMLRHRNGLETAEADYVPILAACTSFVEQSRELAHTELRRLEKQNP
jgi:hypothetical protein